MVIAFIKPVRQQIGWSIEAQGMKQTPAATAKYQSYP
jgi:hypothetical protein